MAVRKKRCPVCNRAETFRMGGNGDLRINAHLDPKGSALCAGTGRKLEQK